MALTQSKVTAQGQISIPADIRRKLGVEPGSTLEWEEDGGRIFVRRASRYNSEDIHQALFGGEKVEPRTLDELKEGVGDHIRKKHARR